MKCHFCNWDNPEGRTNCEKCNQPLHQSTPPNDNDPKTVRQPVNGNSANLKATVRENYIGKANKVATENKGECPECGYKLENGVCSACGYSETKAPKQINNVKNMQIDGKQTIRPHRKGEKEGRFVLTPISEDNGQPEGDIIQFEGNEVALNRENTDPRNSTITSLTQAVVSREDGNWNIVDKSEYHTTFVQASRKVELRNGDLILLGNQLYRFDNLSE